MYNITCAQPDNGNSEIGCHTYSRMRAVPQEKGGTAAATLQETKYVHFLPNQIYPVGSELLMSCLFIKSTFSLEIIYSVITTYQIWLTDVSFRSMGILRCVGTRILFLDVLSAVPPSLSHARKSKPAERRDRSQSTHILIHLLSIYFHLLQKTLVNYVWMQDLSLV